VIRWLSEWVPTSSRGSICVDSLDTVAAAITACTKPVLEAQVYRIEQELRQERLHSAHAGAFVSALATLHPAPATQPPPPRPPPQPPRQQQNYPQQQQQNYPQQQQQYPQAPFSGPTRLPPRAPPPLAAPAAAAQPPALDFNDRKWLEAITVTDGNGSKSLCSKSVRGTCTDGVACKNAHISAGRIARPAQGFDARFLQSIAQMHNPTLSICAPTEKPVRLV
jgi:hypothetical protein